MMLYYQNTLSFVLFLLVHLIHWCESFENILQMKIVDEVSSYGWNPSVNTENNFNLEAKSQPNPYVGPEHLKVLLGTCFTHVDNGYKYRLCPFHNITQHEISNRWNPYNGVLGVWKEWSIDPPLHYHSMVFLDGESCGGDVERQARVHLKCGARTNITSISEPSKCSYLLEFETPLVCHEDSLLIYPTLDEATRKLWDQYEQDLYDGLLTEKGYQYFKVKLFQSAGIFSKNTSEEDMVEKFMNTRGTFDNLEECNREYAATRKRLLKYEL